MANRSGVVDHLEHVAIASMEDSANVGSTMMTSSLVVGVTASTLVVTKGMAVVSEELLGAEEVRARHGFFG